MHPVAPRKLDVSYCEDLEGSEEECYACCARDEPTEVIIKSEYQPSEEEMPKMPLGERQCGDGQESPEKKVLKKSVRQEDIYEVQENPSYFAWQGYMSEHLQPTNNGVLGNSYANNHSMDERRWTLDTFYKDPEATKSWEELMYEYDFRARENPQEVPLFQPTKQRWYPKKKFQNKRRRSSMKRFQSSRLAARKRAYEEHRGLHSRPSKTIYFGPGGYGDEQATKCSENGISAPIPVSDIKQERDESQAWSIKHSDVTSRETWEVYEEDCYACCAKEESTKVTIKLKYNSINAPCKEAEKPGTVLVVVKRERHCGVGQENLEPERKEKSPMKMEDPKNPPSIPRSGFFFEHDLRRTNDGLCRIKKRHPHKYGKDEGSWKHDRFQKDKQAPKSREELIAEYGYDIRDCKNPDEIPPKKPRSRHLQYSVAPRRGNKEPCHRNERPSPPPNMCSDPGGHRGEHPPQFTQNENHGPSSMSQVSVQAENIKPPCEGSSSHPQNQRPSAKDPGIDQGHPPQERHAVKTSYARPWRSRGKKRRDRTKDGHN